MNSPVLLQIDIFYLKRRSVNTNSVNTDTLERINKSDFIAEYTTFFTAIFIHNHIHTHRQSFYMTLTFPIALKVL